MGGEGWYGTVGAGYDWQFNQTWVAGILADGQFGSLRGSLNDNLNNLTGSVKLQDTWAVGARIGWLVAPNVLSYVNGGFTQSYWSGTQLGAVTGTAPTATTPSFNRSGWFGDLPSAGADDLDLAGLSLQLGRTGGCQVLRLLLI